MKCMGELAYSITPHAGLAPAKVLFV